MTRAVCQLKTHGTELSTRPQPFAEGRFLLEEERVAEGPAARRGRMGAAHMPARKESQKVQLQTF